MERVVYDHSVEGLFVRALGSQLTPTCRRELKEAGLDLAAKLKPQYPAESYEQFIRIARRHLYPDLPDADAYRKMGERFVEGYFETAIGRALKTLLKLLGPSRNMERMPQNFAGGTSYVRATLEKHAPSDYSLTVTNVGGYPTFTQGSIFKALELSGAVDCTVTFVERPDGSALYRARWAR